LPENEKIVRAIVGGIRSGSCFFKLDTKPLFNLGLAGRFFGAIVMMDCIAPPKIYFLFVFVNNKLTND
jgi:hypothetical protein